MELKTILNRVLQYSIDKKLSHIPSALSMLHYTHELFRYDDSGSSAVIEPYEWNIVIGKPFGAQAYYIIWHYYYMLNIDNLSYGVKHDEIDFVDYGEETLGNALGFASGISYNGKRTYCNISDAALQMGPTLEAIQYIGKHKQNIVLTVDYNRTQLTGNTTDILGMTVNGVYDMFYNAGWIPFMIEESKFNAANVKSILDNMQKPIVFLIETIKGDGVIEMIKDPVHWHYKQLEDIREVTLCEDI